MNRRIQLIVAVLAILSQAAIGDSLSSGQGSPSVGFAGARGAGLPERVLHFPPGRAVGRIRLMDETYIIPEVSREFHPGYVFAQANTWDWLRARCGSRPASARLCTWGARV